MLITYTYNIYIYVQRYELKLKETASQAVAEALLHLMCNFSFAYVPHYGYLCED